MKKYVLSTNEKQEWINLDRYLYDAVKKSGVVEGIALVYSPHTTAGITVNENADEDVVRDLILGLDHVSPDRKEYRHFEGNSPAHLKASLVGSSAYIIVHNGKPQLGTWQSVFFCEFDGPRSRNIWIQVMGK